MGAASRKRGLGFEYERGLRQEGYLCPAGLDEAGRGCLAGPVVVAAVILDPGRRIRGLDDSKRLPPAERERLSRLIEERALAVSVFEAAHDLVDRINVYQATVQAMLGALRGLSIRPDALLVDGMRLPVPGLHQRSIAGGDAACASIAAASILAKVRRDATMIRLHGEFPAYNFASNKGYGTQEHRSALAAYGPCPYHRASFRGVRDLCLPFPGRVAAETP